jgi:hypothetical protein
VLWPQKLVALFYKRPWGLGTEKDPSRNRVWNRVALSHEISIFNAGKDFSSSKCDLVSLRNFHTGGIDSYEESIPSKHADFFIIEVE